MQERSWNSRKRLLCREIMPLRRLRCNLASLDWAPMMSTWMRIAKSQRHELNFPTILPVLHELLCHPRYRKHNLNQLLPPPSQQRKHSSLRELHLASPRFPNKLSNLLLSQPRRMLISIAIARDRSRMIHSVSKVQFPKHKLNLKSLSPTKSPTNPLPPVRRPTTLLTMVVMRTITTVLTLMMHNAPAAPLGHLHQIVRVNMPLLVLNSRVQGSKMHRAAGTILLHLASLLNSNLAIYNKIKAMDIHMVIPMPTINNILNTALLTSIK